MVIISCLVCLACPFHMGTPTPLPLALEGLLDTCPSHFNPSFPGTEVTAWPKMPSHLEGDPVTIEDIEMETHSSEREKTRLPELLDSSVSEARILPRLPSHGSQYSPVIAYSYLSWVFVTKSVLVYTGTSAKCTSLDPKSGVSDQVGLKWGWNMGF